jgi:monoamine oxidase
MENSSFDALVIGAGASGLVAALEIALTGRRVAVIEAKDRAGGRVYTFREKDLLVELGAEFVHGNLPLTEGLLKKAGAELVPVKGSIWQHRDGQLGEQGDFIEDYSALQKKFKSLEGDKPVAQFLQEDLAGEKYEPLRSSLKNYVEGYYAADTSKSSTRALCEELTTGDEEQYRVEGGYQVLINYLEEKCREKGVQFFLSQPVLQLQWKEGEAIAITEKGSFQGRKLLVTVPLGVLQKEGITFFPALPAVKKAVQRLGFGHVIKLVMQFEDSFWKDQSLTDNKDLSDAGFLFSGETIPTWWTHHPKEDAVLIGWLGGPKAERLHLLTKEELVSKAIFSLSRIFNLDVLHLQQKLAAAHCYNWSADPHFGGAYAYEVVNGDEAIRTLQQPVHDTLFFAGEGLHPGPQIGTVEGALVNGRDAAHRLIASFEH